MSLHPSLWKYLQAKLVFAPLERALFSQSSIFIRRNEQGIPLGRAGGGGGVVKEDHAAGEEA